MARPQKVLILEMIPRNEGKDEGLVLYNFLKMKMPTSVRYKVLKNKKEFIAALENIAPNYSLIHISSHGRKEGYLSLPRGYIEPHEFPEGCFTNSEVAFSSCQVGRSGFTDRLNERTGLRIAIAPLNDVVYIDAAMWFLHYYYLRCHQRYSAWDSFRRTDGKLRDKIRGGFKFFEYR